MMSSRGFPESFFQWIKQILIGGHTCINVNGYLSQYFPVKRGLKQGDPISPILFNLVADTLNIILKKARQQQLIEGLGPKIDEGQAITNLHYAYDTMVFVRADPHSIKVIKWSFIAFEALTGLKVNYDKSDIYPINLSEEDSALYAQIFGCKVANWPLLYLGIPISWKKISLKEWQIIIDKFQKRLSGWKCKFLSYGGKLVLINSVLSSLSTYILSFHKILEKIRKKLDKIRADFLWNSKEQKKIHLCRFDTLARPKMQGGVGIVNLKMFNLCLLAKWAWKLKDPSCQSWWKLALLDKYASRNNRHCSELWRNIRYTEQLIKMHRHFILGNGQDVSFWHDVWCGDTSLSIAFHEIYTVCTNKNISVAYAIQDGRLELHFSRQFSTVMREKLVHLSTQISRTGGLNTNPDVVRWMNKDTDEMSTSNLYQWIMNSGVIGALESNIWLLKIPLKIQMFLWLLSKRRILVKTNLVKRGINADTKCGYCAQDESLNHLFFKCPHVVPIWNWVCTKMNSQIPTTFNEIYWCIDSCDKKIGMSVICAAVLWVCWLDRNLVCFQYKQPYTTHMFKRKIYETMMYWAVGWDAETEEQLDQWLRKLEEELMPQPQGGLTQLDDI